MSIIVDALTINRIEREIGRRLTLEELEDARYQGQVFVRNAGGELVGYDVDRYRLPQDLISDKCDYEQFNQHNADFFSTISESIESPDEF